MLDQPVGVFDSGLGGVSVLREAVRIMPHETFLYYGDNANAPYGDRSEDEITALTFDCAHFLQKQGAKIILIACNTATATCVSRIREELDIPVVSIEPAIKPACEAPGAGKILMAATLATTRLARYRALQARMKDPSRVINVPCPGLVDRIEQGVFAADAFDDLFDTYFRDHWDMPIDGIVLGCTHYVFIRDAFARYARMHFQGESRLYDGNLATARQLQHVLEKKSLAKTQGEGRVCFYTSGDEARFAPLFDRLLNLSESLSGGAPHR